MISGVSIVVTAPDGRPVASALSDDRGHFEVARLAPGAYVVTASSQGLQDLRRAVALAPGQNLDLSLDFQLASISQNVDVRPEVKTDIGVSMGSTVTVNVPLLQETPQASSTVQSVLPLLPGVVRGPDGINIKGGRPPQSTLQIDGGNVADATTGDADFRLPSDAVASMEVLPNPYAVEFGRFSSGVTVIQTRKGGNTWKTSLSGINPAFSTKRGSLVLPGGFESINPRAALGGPLVKGRLFLAESIQYGFSSRDVPSRPVSERVERQSLSSFTRVDMLIAPGHLLAATLAVLPERRRFVNLDTFNPPDVTYNTRQRVYNIAVSETASLSSSALLESAVRVNQHRVNVAGQAGSGMEILPSGNEGTYFNTQERQARSVQWIESWSGSRLGPAGQHVFRLGLDVLHAEYDGTSNSLPVSIRRVDGTLAQMTTFDGPASLHVASTDLAVFAQDRWQPGARLILEAGLRLDRDGVLKRTNVTPRAGARLGLDKNNRATIGGGFGLFYERTPLTVGAFEAFERRSITRFAPDGWTPLGPPTVFVPGIDSALRTPHAMTWNVEYNHWITPDLLFRANYLSRRGADEYLVESSQEGPVGRLWLNSLGRSRYREMALTVRYAATNRLTIDVSYVRASSVADSNSYDAFFGTIRDPLIRANAFAPTNADVPNRVVGQVRLHLEKWWMGSVWELRNGFPYSAVNEQQEFVGPRNQAGRLPKTAAVDLFVERRIKLLRWRPFVGLHLINAFNNFAPRDVQRNIDLPSFGYSYNADPRRLRITLRGF